MAAEQPADEKREVRSALRSRTGDRFVEETDRATDPTMERDAEIACAVAVSSAISGLEALKA